jgi:hypothetical protein
LRFEETPVLETRTAAQVLEELRRRRPSFLPDWEPSQQDPGDALSRIVARYAQVVIDRLNQAPDRNFLAFLDMLGISLIPARPARAPVVFKTFAGMGDGRAPAGTRVGAAVQGAASPVVFETESSIALAGARLTDVVTIWPDRDAYCEHTADATGGRPFTLFHPMRPVPHVLYLAHDVVFDVGKDATIEIAIELATSGSTPLAAAWEYWDGQVWQAFKAFDPADAAASQDGTAGFTRSGTISLRPGCGRPGKTSVMGIEALWIRARTLDPLPPDPTRVLPSIDRIRARAVVVKLASPLTLDAAYAGASKLDVTGTFYPFGRIAQPGAVFYLMNDEAFGKPGAKVFMWWALPKPHAGGKDMVIRWQYWNGEGWSSLPGVREDDAYFARSIGVSPNTLSFTVPLDVARSEVGGQPGFWLRAQLVAGSYVKNVEIALPGGKTLQIVETTGAAVVSLNLTYQWRPASEPVQQCATYNDFQFELHSRDIHWPGNFFPPFKPVADATPAMYLGFDEPLPNDLVSIYLDVDETEAELPALIWEGWNGDQWRPLSASDDTASLSRPGMVSFLAPAIVPRPEATVRSAAGARVLAASALEVAPFQPGQLVVVSQGDKREARRISEVQDRVLVLETALAESYNGGTVALAALPRFGTPRDWVRGRLKENGAPESVAVNGIHPNAAWAVQTQTISGEVLGSGNGQPGQTLFFSQFPILPGEDLEVRELEGARASVELPMLREELLAASFGEDDIRVVLDPRSGKAREVWVRWRSRPHLYFSSPTDRHYVVERARGRLLFGDLTNGRLPTVGVDNIRARVYRSGGGLASNVPRGAIDQMLGGALAESVTNPRAAGGGADGESPRGVKDRGPETLRHRWRALSTGDYEAMAREASAGVAAVRVLPATAPNRRPAPGWVTVIIVPQSLEARPQPSLELRQLVHDYLIARSPGTLPSSHVAVIGPTYRPVGVAALVTPRVDGEAGVVADALKAALEGFLHPLAGGPEGHGWRFGRDVFLSDVAALLEAVPGVDYVRQLDLLLDDAPVGPRVEIPTDQMVVAGTLRIEMEARGA